MFWYLYAVLRGFTNTRKSFSCCERYLSCTNVSQSTYILITLLLKNNWKILAFILLVHTKFVFPPVIVCRSCRGYCGKENNFHEVLFRKEIISLRKLAQVRIIALLCYLKTLFQGNWLRSVKGSWDMVLSGDLEGGFLRVDIISDCCYEKAEEYQEILWITLITRPSFEPSKNWWKR
jgi:hypothetical protein